MSDTFVYIIVYVIGLVYCDGGFKFN